jgi:spore coat polysaccharide biosynthesis protein SpsF
MKIVAIIQARMGSTRLPGKVMMDLAGSPMLARVYRRCRRARTPDLVMIATTTGPQDDVIADYCAGQDWPCFRGSEADVLDRYYQAALREGADPVVRITADCPLIEPEFIDLTVTRFLESRPLDYATNLLEADTFPRGLDVEVIAFAALASAWREDDNPAWREHVTPYIYHHPEKFRLLEVMSPVEFPRLRWTVDTPEDLALIRNIYEHFQHDRFSWREVLDLLADHPQWLALNRDTPQKVLA